eukprot:CAMPEP_0196587278 /NCGR_PEP_ID=MMETSP1081-20130531/56987_1 /TAXON_ID=36882 /ORGANISM="Pyramimonas amylifera, Strain CCMP720" /LENGTH=458 /DNA_ID=CAMNT_0041909419 /DNA_START=100 /DNA_END=1476 /DNA_ORIENTATION=+
MWVKLVGYLTDMICFLDMVLLCFTPIYRDGVKVTDLKEIRHHYLTGWFIWDLLATLPWAPLFSASIFGGFTSLKVSQGVTVKQVINCLTLFRLLRFWKLMQQLTEMERYVGHRAALRFLQIFCRAMAFLHWFACVVHGVGLSISEPEYLAAWLPLDDYLDRGVRLQYLFSLYITTNVMYGNLVLPQEEMSVVCSLGLQFFGVCCYAAALSEVMQIKHELNFQKVEYKRMLETTRAYCKKIKISESFTNNYLDYLEKMHHMTNGMDAMTFMQNMPVHYRQEFANHLNGKVFENISVFKDCGVPFVTCMVSHMQPSIRKKNDLICMEGDVGDEMYFLISGEVAVYKTGHGMVGWLEKGSFFGEGVIATENFTTRNATIQAIMDCELYVLTKKDFENVSKYYPGECAVFVKTANYRSEAKKLIVNLNSIMNTSGKGSYSKASCIDDGQSFSRLCEPISEEA